MLFKSFALLIRTLRGYAAQRRLTGCYVFLMLLSSCAEHTTFPSWIEGRWESSPELSIQANKEEFDKAPQSIKDMFYRISSKRFLQISENSMSVEQLGYEHEAVTQVSIHFTIDEIGLILIEDEMKPKAGSRILRVDDDNFCTTMWVESDHELAGTETPIRQCYTRVNT